MTLIVGSAPVGLATGILAWFVAGGATVNADRLDDLQTQISNHKPPMVRPAGSSHVDMAALSAAPLFALTIGPQAIKEPLVRLEGISISRKRTAALMSIEGKPPEWLSVGDKRDGVAMRRITNTGVLIDILTGPRELALGEQLGGDGQVAVGAEGAADPQSSPDQIPPGFRSPLPPASAPQTP